jgi:hypothetical protein
MKSKIFEETSSSSLGKKLNDFFDGKFFCLSTYHQPPKVLFISYSYNRDLKGIYPVIYSALIVYEE